MHTLAEIFQKIKLPTMPEVAQSLIKSLNDEDAPVSVVRNAIAKDPALTVKLLRLANSAKFGLSRQVSSIDDAITLLGMGQVRTLALASCMNDAFPVIEGLDRKAFWSESMACAGYAQWLARGIGADAQQAWLTGFMMRLGELSLAQAIPGCLKEIEKLPHFPGGRWEREQETVGHTEGQVSGEMAKRWNFPEAIAVGLTHSADPLAAHPFSRLAAIVHIAELLAEMAPESTDVIKDLPSEVLAKLQVDLVWMEKKLPMMEAMTDTSTA
jgi:HD-like signal output (HDOD) protein